MRRLIAITLILITTALAAYSAPGDKIYYVPQPKFSAYSGHRQTEIANRVTLARFSVYSANHVGGGGGGGEPPLGNPAANGYILSSTTGGVRSWVAQATGAGIPASTVAGATSYGLSSIVGTSTDYARADHIHGTPASVKDTTAVTGILKGNGTTIAAAVVGDFPILNQNTTGTAAGLSANIAESQVTNLVSDLAAKSSTSHNHAGTYEPTLGNPAGNGQVLASTTTGTRSWYTIPVEKDTTAVTGLLKGNGTSISAAAANVDYLPAKGGFYDTATFSTQYFNISIDDGAGSNSSVTVTAGTINLNSTSSTTLNGSPVVIGEVLGTADSVLPLFSGTGGNALKKATNTGLLKATAGVVSTAVAGTDYVATQYVHPSGDGNLHVPATGTTNNGKMLTAGATAGALSWTTPTVTAAWTNIPNATAANYLPVSGATPFTFAPILATGTGSPVLSVSPTLTGTPAIAAATATTAAATTNTTQVATTAFVKTAAQPVGVAALTAGATVTLTPSVNTSVFTLTPAQACTINAGTAIAGQSFAVMITTSGTTSYVVTFGTNFKTTGTLTTGTVTAKTFMVEFVCSSTTQCNEVSRTVAM